MPASEPIRFGEVGPPWWDDKPVIIVGTGSSLKGFDFRRLSGLGHVLAVKEAIRDLPFAECCFSLDRMWTNGQAPKLAKGRAMQFVFAIEPGHAEKTARIEGALYLKRTRHPGFAEKPDLIQSGGTSGFGAFNYAYHKRAKRIALFGFDYREGRYCPERYTWYKPGQNERYWSSWGKCFAETLPQLKKAGIEVINASPRSTVEAFRKMMPDEAVEWLSRPMAKAA